MRERPGGIDDSELCRALLAWGMDAVSVTYAPLGFGDYHWIAVDINGRKRFVTVADLAHKPYCGVGADAAFAGLSGAMDTALALRDQGLECVVAPLLSMSGKTVHRHGRSLGISIFPLLDGVPGEFSRTLPAPERGALIDQLAALHRAAPPDLNPGPPPAALNPAAAGASAEPAESPMARRAVRRTHQGAAARTPGCISAPTRRIRSVDRRVAGQGTGRHPWRATSGKYPSAGGAARPG